MSAFLEDLVASALQGLLGAYFVGIESQRLKLDVFSGQLVLRDLPVREDALYSLQQPYRVRWGVVGTLRISVPWQRLGKEPVDIVVEDAYVLLEPIKRWDLQEHLRMVRKGKEEEQVRDSRQRRRRQWEPRMARGVSCMSRFDIS